MDYTGIVRKLQDIIIATSTDGTKPKKLISQQLLKSLNEDLTNVSLEQLAEKCFVSPASLSRFIQKLGYANYSEFKIAFKLYNEDRRVKLENETKEYQFEESLVPSVVRYRNSVNSMLDSFIEQLDTEQLDRCCQLVHDFEDVYFFGVHSSGSVLRELQYSLLNLGKYTHYFDGRVNQRRIIKSMNSNSLIVVLSCNGNFFKHLNLNDLIDTLDGKQHKSILITQNKNLSISKLFDEVFLLGKSELTKTAPYQAQFWADIFYARYCYLFHKK